MSHCITSRKTSHNLLLLSLISSLSLSSTVVVKEFEKDAKEELSMHSFTSSSHALYRGHSLLTFFSHTQPRTNTSESTDHLASVLRAFKHLCASLFFSSPAVHGEMTPISLSYDDSYMFVFTVAIFKHCCSSSSFME